MANAMNFGVDLLPTSTNTYNLGDATHKWKINGETPVLTDTKNTAGSTDTTSKIFLIGATSQTDNSQTYSDGQVYVQNGSLFLTKDQDASGTKDNKPALIIGGTSTAQHIEIDGNEILAKTDGTHPSTLYLQDSSGTVAINGTGGLNMAGPLTWKNSTALPKTTTTNVFLTVTGTFADDNCTTKYIPIADVKTVLGMEGATASANGTAGVVPAPPKDGYNTKYLCADGNWKIPDYPTYTLSGLVGSSTIGSSTKPVYWNGSAFVGITSYEGNAATATILQASKTINGTAFDGSANIMTTNWGTARDISISDNDGTNTGTAVSVNGGNDITLTLPSTIKATLSGNAASASKLSNTSKIGATNKPVYFTANGVPAAISYTIGKSVPSSAVFTDVNVKQTLTSDNSNFPLLMAKVDNTDTTTDQTGNVYRNNSIYANPSTGSIYGSQVWGAVWNDYAEFRKDNVKEKELQQPGRCVREVGDGTLTLTDGRLQRGCEIISDTFGFAIGQDKENGYNTPIASSGRVLAYLYEDRELARNFIGWPVCSGPDGTVSIMTEEEENRYSNRIVGTISEIPDYEEWGTGKVKVNGRIWIRIK